MLYLLVRWSLTWSLVLIISWTGAALHLHADSADQLLLRVSFGTLRLLHTALNRYDNGGISLNNPSPVPSDEQQIRQGFFQLRPRFSRRQQAPPNTMRSLVALLTFGRVANPQLAYDAACSQWSLADFQLTLQYLQTHYPHRFTPIYLAIFSRECLTYLPFGLERLRGLWEKGIPVYSGPWNRLTTKDIRTILGNPGQRDSTHWWCIWLERGPLLRLWQFLSSLSLPEAVTSACLNARYKGRWRLTDATRRQIPYTSINRLATLVLTIREARDEIWRWNPRKRDIKGGGQNSIGAKVGVEDGTRLESWSASTPSNNVSGSTPGPKVEYEPKTGFNSYPSRLRYIWKGLRDRICPIFTHDHDSLFLALSLYCPNTHQFRDGAQLLSLLSELRVPEAYWAQLVRLALPWVDPIQLARVLEKRAISLGRELSVAELGALVSDVIKYVPRRSSFFRIFTALNVSCKELILFLPSRKLTSDILRRLPWSWRLMVHRRRHLRVPLLRAMSEQTDYPETERLLSMPPPLAGMHPNGAHLLTETVLRAIIKELCGKEEEFVWVEKARKTGNKTREKSGSRERRKRIGNGLYQKERHARWEQPVSDRLLSLGDEKKCTVSRTSSNAHAVRDLSEPPVLSMVRPRSHFTAMVKLETLLTWLIYGFLRWGRPVVRLDPRWCSYLRGEGPSEQLVREDWEYLASRDQSIPQGRPSPKETAVGGRAEVLIPGSGRESSSLGHDHAHAHNFGNKDPPSSWSKYVQQARDSKRAIHNKFNRLYRIWILDDLVRSRDLCSLLAKNN